MASQWRRVSLAPAHSLLARIVPGAAADGDRVLVTVRGRGRMHVSTDLWNAAEVHHG